MREPSNSGLDTRTKRRAAVWLLGALSLFLSPSVATAQGKQQFSVSYQSQTTVYVDGGSASGLFEGQKLRVTRDGKTIALLKVDYVATHSSSCKVLSSSGDLRRGDMVEAVDDGSIARATTTGDLPSQRPQEAKSLDPSLPAVRAPTPEPRPLPRPTTHRPKVSGSLTAGFLQYDDTGQIGRDFEETTARLKLRARNLWGGSWNLYTRLRTRDTQRHRLFESNVPDHIRSDRLYELSLVYQPEDGRTFAQFGRLGSTPFSGLGYLDGALGQFRVSRTFHIGAFAGSQPEIRDLYFEQKGTKAGAFLRFTSTPRSPFFADVVFAGVSERAEGEVSREYIAIQARMRSGTRWTFLQRGEIDLNRDWRADLSDQEYQLSNLTLYAAYRLSARMRFNLSYDQRRRFRDANSRDTPEELFDDLLRQGLRATLSFQKPRKWAASLGYGQRRREATQEPTSSLSASFQLTDIGGVGIQTGLNYSSFSGAVTEGSVMSLRARKTFRGGHDIGLVFGSSANTLFGQSENRNNDWIRLRGCVELPRRLFSCAELEDLEGDDRQGTRSRLEIGIRF